MIHESTSVGDPFGDLARDCSDSHSFTIHLRKFSR
jgi:hypothetical protein